MKGGAIVIVFLSLLQFSCLLSCTDMSGRNAKLSETEVSDSVKADVALWVEMVKTVRFEDLIKHATDVYYRAAEANDYRRMTFAAAYIAQSYMILNDIDSASYYLDRIESRYLEDDIILWAMVHNISATYAMRAHLDYGKALNDYNIALESMAKIGNIDNQVSILCNIVNIYLEREDSTGLQFAERAYVLGKRTKDKYVRINAGIAKSQMLLLSERYDEACVLLKETSNIADSIGCEYFNPVFNMEYAYIYDRIGDSEKANDYYKKALAERDVTESGTVIRILQHYADFLMSQEDYSASCKLYKEALELSYSTGNIEARYKILTGLSEALFLLGREDDALEAYRNAHRYQDTLLSKQKEMEFNKLQISFERKERENELAIRDLTLAKSRRTAAVIILFLLLSVGIVSAVLFYVGKRNRMYRVMVEKYQEQLEKNKMLRNLSEESQKLVYLKKDVDSLLVDKLAKEDHSDTSEAANENLLNIFMSIEKLMKEEKLYKDKEISLENIASRLATNRSYISRAINTYAYKTFYNYINAYRVEEATMILSDVSHEIALKNLAGDLGYNSTSAFYRAFQKETGCPPSKYREQVLKFRAVNYSA